MRSRQIRVSFYQSNSEHLHLKKQAANAGISMSDLIRQLVAGCEVKPKPTEGYAAILKQISGIARNINQIAFLANSTHQVSHEDIQKLQAMQSDIWQLVKRL